MIKINEVNRVNVYSALKCKDEIDDICNHDCQYKINKLLKDKVQDIVHEELSFQIWYHFKYKVNYD